MIFERDRFIIHKYSQYFTPAPYPKIFWVEETRVRHLLKRDGWMISRKFISVSDFERLYFTSSFNNKCNEVHWYRNFTPETLDYYKIDDPNKKYTKEWWKKKET